MPKIAVYVEPFDGYGDFAHFRDIAEWLKKTYPDHQVVPICVRRSDWGTINDSHVERMLEEFHNLGWNTEETASDIEGLRQCGDLLIADTPDKLPLGELRDYSLAVSISSNSSPFGLLYALSQKEGFTGKILHLREIGDLIELRPEDDFSEAQSEITLEILDRNPLESSTFTMGLAYHKREANESGFMFTEPLPKRPLREISDKTFLAHVLGDDTEENVEIIATYYQNVNENPSIAEHSATIHLISSIVAVANSPVVQQREEQKTLCFTSSRAGVHSPQELIEAVEELAAKQAFTQPIGSIEVTVKDKEGNIKTVIKKLNEGGINIRVVGGFFLSNQDQATLLGNSRSFMGCSGDKSLVETMSAGALPLCQVRDFKEDAIKALANDIYTLVERGSVSEEQALKLIQYFNAVSKHHQQIKYMSDFQDIFNVKHVEQLGHLSDLITPELLSTWQVYANFLREERNVMPVLELNANESLGLETSQEIREAASLVTARTPNTGAWLHRKITESVKEKTALITRYRDQIRELINTIQDKIAEIKQHPTPSQASIDRLSKIIKQLDSIDEDYELYARSLRSSTFFIREETATTALLDKLSEVEEKAKSILSLASKFEEQLEEFNSYLSEESQCNAMKSKAMKKIKSFITGQATEPLTEQELDALKDSPQDTLDDIAKKYFGESYSDEAIKFLEGGPTEPDAAFVSRHNTGPT